jgi:Glycerol-3-phosphate cytidylyltransferase (EC 2.7.7.39)
VDRVATYIKNLEEALEGLVLKDPAFRHIVELARAYLKDSKYYYSIGDRETALSTVSYAEGLLDALKMAGVADFVWKRPSEIKNVKTVMVAGTFEILHPGHITYLREAWKLGYVTAVVSSDENAERIKGRKIVIPQQQRAEVLSSLYYIHKVVPGRPGDIFEILGEVKPDIILLGPNQKVSEDVVKSEAKKRGVEAEVVRLSDLKQCELCSTTRIIDKILAAFCNASQH